MAGLRLYELPEAIRQIEAQIIDADGELTPELEAELDALEGAFHHKAEFIALLAREAKAEGEAWKAEEARIRGHRIAAENREARLKGYLHTCMERLGVKRVDGQRAKVALQQSSRPSITWTGSTDAIPEDFLRVTLSVDGAKAYEEWKAGAELPTGFLVSHSTHVRIR